MEFRPDANGLVDSNPFRSCLLLRERTCGRWLTAQEIFKIEFEFGDSVVNNYWYCEQDSTVANYYREFVDWKRWAASYFDDEDSDEVVVRIFVRGLQDSIRNQMPSSLPTNLSCAYWEAVAIELSLQLSSQLSTAMKKHFAKGLESNSAIKFDVLKGVDESTFQGSENSYSHLEKAANEPWSGYELQPDASLMIVEHPESGKVFGELPERNLPRKQKPEFSSLNDKVYANFIDAHRLVIVNERVDIVLKDFKYDSRKLVQDALIFHKWKDRGIVPHGCWLNILSVILSIPMAWFDYDWIVMVVEKNKELDVVWRIAALQKVLKEMHPLFTVFYGFMRALLEKEPGGGLIRNKVLLPGAIIGIRCTSPGRVKLVEQKLWQREEQGLIGISTVRDEAEAKSVVHVLSSGLGTEPGERSLKVQIATDGKNEQEVVQLPFFQDNLNERGTVQGSLLKKVLEAVKDLVNKAHFACSASGFSLQTMDSSHVTLLSLLLRSKGFRHYRCERNLSMGINIGNVAKMIQCFGADDIITLKADVGSDTVPLMFESPSQDKISDFEMKLMDIDSEHLCIPEAEYETIVQMPASEFARICKDLSSIGDTVIIYMTKAGVQFFTRGDIGTANIILKQNTSVDKSEDATIIDMQEPVSLTFALRYMNSFTKGTVQILTVGRAAPIDDQSLVQTVESCAGITTCYSMILFQDLLVPTILHLDDSISLFTYAIMRLYLHVVSSGTSSCAGQFYGCSRDSTLGGDCNFVVPRPLQHEKWFRGKDGFLEANIWSAKTDHQSLKCPAIWLHRSCILRTDVIVYASSGSSSRSTKIGAGNELQPLTVGQREISRPPFSLSPRICTITKTRSRDKDNNKHLKRASRLRDGKNVVKTETEQENCEEIEKKILRVVEPDADRKHDGSTLTHNGDNVTRLSSSMADRVDKMYIYWHQHTNLTIIRGTAAYVFRLHTLPSLRTRMIFRGWQCNRCRMA